MVHAPRFPPRARRLRLAPNARVAAFDLDDTLQKTRSGKPGYMVTDLADFVYWSDAVRPKIRELHAQGVKIVVFSNQGGVKGAFEGKRAAVVRARIDALAADLQVPLDAFFATQKGPEKDPKGFANPSRACGIISRARVTAG